MAMNLAVKTFRDYVGDFMPAVGDHIVESPGEHPGDDLNRLETTAGRLVVPAAEEVTNQAFDLVRPDVPQVLLDAPGSSGADGRGFKLTQLGASPRRPVLLGGDP
jgi:hypothetical protein